MKKLKTQNTCHNCAKGFYLRPILYSGGELFCNKFDDRPKEPHEMVGLNPADKELGYEKWNAWAQEHKVNFNNFCGVHKRRLANAVL